MIPKYRYVEYADDGVVIYQCLACKCMMHISGMPMNYCPGCGILWTGQLVCRAHSQPRWLYEMFGERVPWEFSEKHLGARSNRNRLPTWEYQMRYAFGSGELGKWERRGDMREMSAIDAKRRLDDERLFNGDDDDYVKSESRIVLVP